MKATKKKPGRSTSSAREALAASAVPITSVEKVLGLSLNEARKLHCKLTERQRQVAGLMARGMQNRQIAEQLGISPKTLDIHRGDVFHRLKVKTSAAVARVVFLTALGDEVG